jgi:hypothetical protein
MSVSLNEIVINSLIVIVAALISGLLGVLISNRDFKKTENRRAKLEVLQQLMANRFNTNREGFAEALNQVFVVYYDAPGVLTALNEFHEYITLSTKTAGIADQKLLKLYKAMCKEVNMNTVTDKFLLRAFQVPIENT